MLRQVQAQAVALLGAGAALPEQTLFADDLGLDSLALVDWTLALEDCFDIELPEEDVTAVPTLGGLVDLIVRTLDVGHGTAAQHGSS